MITVLEDERPRETIVHPEKRDIRSGEWVVFREAWDFKFAYVLYYIAALTILGVCALLLHGMRG